MLNDFVSMLLIFTLTPQKSVPHMWQRMIFGGIQIMYTVILHNCFYVVHWDALFLLQEAMGISLLFVIVYIYRLLFWST